MIQVPQTFIIHQHNFCFVAIIYTFRSIEIHLILQVNGNLIFFLYCHSKRLLYRAHVYKNGTLQ